MKIILTIFFSLLMSSCPSNNNQETAAMISIYEGSLKGDGSEGFTKQNIVINSTAEWQDFLTKTSVDSQFKDAIDFSQKTVLVAVDSKRNTGGFSIEVSEIIKKEGKFQVTISSEGPKPTDMVTMSLTQPIHIVKINKTSKEIVFVTK